jgi:hypothetical protein
MRRELEENYRISDLIISLRTSMILFLVCTSYYIADEVLWYGKAKGPVLMMHSIGRCCIVFSDLD